MCCCSAVCVLFGGLLFSLYTVLLSFWCKCYYLIFLWQKSHQRTPGENDAAGKQWYIYRDVINVSSLITEWKWNMWHELSRSNTQPHDVCRSRSTCNVILWDLFLILIVYDLYCSSHMCRHHSGMFVLFSQFFNQCCQRPVWSGTSRA